jgi:hypothetical protein
MLMPWGKYRDEEVHTLPTDYLAWLIEECEDDEVREEAEQEFQRRQDSGEL